MKPSMNTRYSRSLWCSIMRFRDSPNRYDDRSSSGPTLGSYQTASVTSRSARLLDRPQVIQHGSDKQNTHNATSRLLFYSAELLTWKDREQR